jgi:hypothetical protein
LENSKKLFADHLPGGKFSSPTDVQLRKSASCPSHNIAMERLMDNEDRALHNAPNTNQPTAESKIMYRDNAVGEWLQEKELSAQEAYITDARRKSRKHLKKAGLKDP